MDVSRFRNIGIMAHIDAGKTTTSERILYYTGKIHKMGEVHEGTATMDWMPQEQERGITITSAAITTFWKDYRINLIDTPGHVDFTIEVERSLRVLDGAVGVFDASQGVEPQTETVWRQADKYDVPRLAFLNKMDKVGADFEMCLNDMKTKLNTRPLLLQLPIYENRIFVGIYDLIEQISYIWTSDDKDAKPTASTQIPSSLEENAYIYRQELIETLADFEDKIAEAILSEEEMNDIELIRATIRKATLSRALIPVLVGSSFKNKGVLPLLDSVIWYLPSPLDRKPAPSILVEGLCESQVRPFTKEEPFSGIIFKVATDPFVGSLCYLRIYSGVLKSGETILNVLKNKRERIQKIFLMSSNNREELAEASVGEIVGIVGSKLSTTGDTLSDLKHPIVYEKMTFPEPVISLALEPKNTADIEKLQVALDRLTQEDPSLKSNSKDESGQMIISGMGELHLQIIVDRLKREFNLPVNIGKPQVSYRESIKKSSSGTSLFERTVQGKIFQARVSIHLEPHQESLSPVLSVKERSDIPKPLLSVLKEALNDAVLGGGALCGYPLVYLKVHLSDYSFDPGNTDDACYKAATAQAFRRALDEAHPILMEPIMQVEITSPEEYAGGLISDVNSRRGHVQNVEQKHHLQAVQAQIPLADLFGYETDIRSLSQGRASSSMMFNHYNEVPKNLEGKILGLT